MNAPKELIRTAGRMRRFSHAIVTLAALTALLSGATRGSAAVVCWGSNRDGQLNVPTDLEDATGIAAGYEHTVAIDSTGRVRAWGRNDWGQTKVPAILGPVVSVAAGMAHTLALRGDGTVAAWGYNG